MEFGAVHVSGHWAEYGFGRWITIQPSTRGSINSIQNGMLLRSDIRNVFDTYVVSINPNV